MRLILPLMLMLTACSPDLPVKNYEADYEAENAALQNRIAGAIKKGDLTLSREYYRPDLTGDRWFKVEDQYGCKWWINSGHKFDQRQIDVRGDGEANCPDAKNAPEKEYIYRDRSGKVINIYDFH